MQSLTMPPIAVGEILNAASAGSAPTSGLAQQFARAIESAQALGRLDGGNETSAVARVLMAQDQASREKSAAVREMAHAAAVGDDDALDVGRQIALFDQMAATSFQFSACVHVAQSTKNGLQTLMRNQ